MIHFVSQIIEHPTIKDYCKVVVTRQESNINNNKAYNQEVSGSFESVKWFRQAIIEKMNQQSRGA